MLHLTGPRHDLLNSLGSVLYESRDSVAARTQFCLALTLAPGNAKVLHNHALAYPDTPAEGALLWCERALQVDPTRIDFAYTRACLFYDRRLLAAASEAYAEVIRREPQYAKAHWNQANIDLLLGRYADGWRRFEWRWLAKGTNGDVPPNTVGAASWDSSTLRGKTLVLRPEQGLGDTLQFCRYARLAAERGARVFLQVPDSLVRLLRGQRWSSALEVSAEGSVEVRGLAAPLPSFDLHCPLMSLPLAFGTTLETIPYGKQPYLQALPDDVERWGRWLDERLAIGSGAAGPCRPRVGLVWNGGFRADQPDLWAVNERRNVPLELFAAALDLPGIDFMSLQKGDPAESQLRGREAAFWKTGRLLNAAGELNDFADTAGLMANLDLVISVDTSTAHLAAALGKPVWILNRFDTCWQWLLDRSDSPWYGSVTLYRQGSDRDWRPVLAKVAEGLQSIRGSPRIT